MMTTSKLYAREDPKFVRTYFDELKQHDVPFRTCMQWLSRVYGGRGGYTSEELYKIIKGKEPKGGGYFIFPFVKGAPPEVNRILERTYRTHREAGNTKVAAAIAAWSKVKQAGYVKTTKPGPAWVKQRSYEMKPMVNVNYGIGIGAGIGKLTERGVRGLWRQAKKRKVATAAIGAAGAGYIIGKRRRPRMSPSVMPMYALGNTLHHFTPDVPPPGFAERLGAARQQLHLKPLLTKQVGTAKVVGQQLGHSAARGVKWVVTLLVVKELLDWLSRKGRPIVPEIRPDIETLSGFKSMERVVKYTSVIPTPALELLRSKTTVALKSVKRGTERGLLLWLLGFISAELLARGITKPKSEQTILLPQFKQPKSYARGRIADTGGERLPKRGFQSFSPRMAATADMGPMPTWKRGVLGSGVSGRSLAKAAGSAALLTLATGVARQIVLSNLEKRGWKQKLKKKWRQVRKKLKFEQNGLTQMYTFRSAAGKLGRGMAKVGGKVGWGLNLATNVAIPAMLVSEFWPRKKKRPPVLKTLAELPQMQFTHNELYVMPKFKILKKLLRRKGESARLRRLNVQRGISEATHQVEQTRKKMILAGKFKKPYALWVEQYPFKSAAQRRFLHWKHPKMAEEWEEKTPKGKKLPEHVKKNHLTPCAVQYTLPSPMLLKHVRGLVNLRGSQFLGRDLLTWSRNMANRMKTLADASGPAQQITARGMSVPAREWFTKAATNWETVADQVGDVLAKSQLERVGAGAAAVTAGVVAHQVGKKREKERIKKLIG